MQARLDALLRGAARALHLTDDRPGLLRTLLLTAGIYLLVAWLYPGREQRLLRHALTIAMTAALLLTYACGLGQVRRSLGSTRGVLIGGFLILAAAALWIPPFQSSDLHAYGQIGWLQAGHGANPYVTVPSDLPDWRSDAMFTRTWKDTPCVYGFFFAHVTKVVAWAGGGDPMRTMLLFKLLGIALLGGIGVALWRWLHEQPGPHADRALVLFLWSPFLLLQFVSNGHNDLLFAAFLLVALRAARRERWWVVLPALTLAVLVKLVALVLFPTALVLLVRRWGGARACGALLGALLLGGVISLPYSLAWSEFRWAGIQAQLATPSYSLVALLADLWATLAHPFETLRGSIGPVTAALQGLFLGAFLVFFLVRLRRAWRRTDYGSAAFLEDAVALLFALIVLASGKFFPWYLGMFLPAALLLPDRHPLRRMSVLLTISWMLVFTPIGKARMLDALLMTALPLLLYWIHERSKGRGRSPAR